MKSQGPHSGALQIWDRVKSSPNLKQILGHSEGGQITVVTPPHAGYQGFRDARKITLTPPRSIGHLQLYTSPASPFGARVLIAARVKGLDIDQVIVRAAELKQSAFLAINPMGRIPVLYEGDRVIAESETILRYLEDLHPVPSLLPITPRQRAQMNLLIRITDYYLMAPLLRLLPHINPIARDARVVTSELDDWRSALTYLEHALQVPVERIAIGFSLADCVLPPSIHFCHRFAAIFDMQNTLDPYPAINQYYAWAVAHPVIGPVLSDLSVAQSSR